MSASGDSGGLGGLTKAESSIHERSEMIENSQWAEGVNFAAIETIAKYVETYRVGEGAVIFNEGAQEAYMCLVIEGRVSILKLDSAQQYKEVGTCGPGKTFGEMSLIDDDLRSASAIALKGALLLVLTKQNFLRLAEEHPLLGFKILQKLSKLVSQRLRQTSGTLVEFLPG